MAHGGGAPVRAAVGTIVFALCVPGTAIGLVPFLLTRWQPGPPLLGLGATRWIGAALFLLAVPLFLDFLARFVREGRGTPAPVAPTERLVVGGPYRHVRNPGYVAVLAMLAGEGLFFASVGVLLFAAAAALCFHVFVVLYEEPTLRRTFGADYAAYHARVPRWLPRLTLRRPQGRPERDGGGGPVEDLRPALRQRTASCLARLSHAEREALLVRCWMSHDARWFVAVAQAFGIEAANRLNQTAAHEEGRVEARRIVRALGLPQVATVDDYLAVQEVIIGLLGPDLLDYEVVRTAGDAFEIRIARCFAHENVVRAGVGEVYECGIMARVTGWLEGLGVAYEIDPAPGRCFRVEGRACAYRFAVRARVA